jgi:putative hydrolase of HD superfamily
MEHIDKLHYLYKLKEVERATKVKDRQENSAEHTWGAMLLALHFLKKIKSKKLDEHKVLKLLLYHDMVEIEAGDTPELKQNLKEKASREKKAFEKIYKKMPPTLRKEYKEHFEEYESQKTDEAKFAKAIDKIDTMIHAWNVRHEWKKSGYNQKTLNEKKRVFLKEFPEVLEFYDGIVEHLKEQGHL